MWSPNHIQWADFPNMMLYSWRVYMKLMSNWWSPSLVIFAKPSESRIHVHFSKIQVQTVYLQVTMQMVLSTLRKCPPPPVLKMEHVQPETRWKNGNVRSFDVCMIAGRGWVLKNMDENKRSDSNCNMKRDIKLPSCFSHEKHFWHMSNQWWGSWSGSFCVMR